MIKKIIFFFLVITLFNQNFVIAAQPALQSQTKNVESNAQAAKDTYYEEVDALDVVKYPNKYKNRCIKINAIFDKFSVVGLDYKPAFRSSEDYILFLIRKTEIKGHIIPLAEMKIFITRDEAEKYIDLESGDAIQFTGKVFSTALGDPWIEVNSLKIIDKKNKKTEAEKKLKTNLSNPSKTNK